jgi:hypothetical protein
MNAKKGSQFLNLFVVVLFLLGTALSGFVRVMAEPASAPAEGLVESAVAQTSTTVTIPTSADTYMSTNAKTANYGKSDPILMTRDSNTRGALFKFELDDIPEGANITGAKLVMYITDKDTKSKNTHDPLYLYNMRRDWVEGTGTGSGTANGATWNTYDGTTSHTWGPEGAASTMLDRYDTNLWTAVWNTFQTTGTVEIPLNEQGIAVVQGWLDGTLPNYGIIMQNYSQQANFDFKFTSKEGANQGENRLKLVVTYEEAPPGPMITTSVSSLQPFASKPGTPSDPQSYTVTGANLTEEIAVNAPEGFELAAAAGGPYASSLSLPLTGGTVYVRLHSATQGNFGGNITHSSAGAQQKDVAVDGMTTQQVCYTDVEFVAVADTYIGVKDTSTDMEKNYGGQADMRISRTTSPNVRRRGGLLRFKLDGEGGIPAGAIIEKASLFLSVKTVGTANNQADHPLYIYEMLRAWVEGTGSATTPPDGATWETYQGFSNSTEKEAVRWQTNGAVGANDRGTVNLWTATSIAFNSTGNTTTLLNEAGIAVVQGWVNDPNTNFGVTLQNYHDSANFDVTFHAKEATTAANRPKLIVDYCIGAGNEAPNPPVLVRPDAGAVNVTIPPTLEVTVSDPDGDAMSVSFYGRAVNGSVPAEDFLFIAVPDTQKLARHNPDIMKNQFQWIASRYTTPGAGEPELVFVTSLGDIVDQASAVTEWQVADESYGYLDTAGTPYSVAPGNHDTGTLYSTYFGSSRFTGKPWYGGYYTSGTDNYNNYSLFSAGGMDFILINLQYNPGAGALSWADGLLKTYSDRRAIVEQHDILHYDNNWVNQTTYDALKGNPNLFLMLCGHMHSGDDGSAYRRETRTGMQDVHILMTNYQDRPTWDYLRLLTFKPGDDEIYAQVFSPHSPGGYLTSASNYEQFTMSYEMDGSSASSFKLIGTQQNVASGGNASVIWSGLKEGTEYEWYVDITDGSKTTTGPTWNFSTSGEEPPIEIKSVAVAGIDAPVALATPDTTADVPVGSKYTAGTVTWDPAHASFAYSTIYTASVTLTAAQGYYFSASPSGTVNGNLATSVARHSDTSLTVSYTFPSTSAEPGESTGQITFGMDMHQSTSNFSAFLTCVKNDGVTPDVVAQGGDFNNYQTSGTAYNSSVIDPVVEAVFPGVDKIYTQGNNDSFSLVGTGNFKVTGVVYEKDDYIIYGINEYDFPLSSISSNGGGTAVKNAAAAQTISDLQTFLTSKKGAGKVIFILSHVPLHQARNDNPYGYAMASMLNNVIDGDLDVVFLWGHNHTQDPTQNYKNRNEQVTFNDNGTGRTLNIKFIYAAAGYVNGSSTNSNVIDSGTVATVTDTEIILTRYRRSNCNKTETLTATRYSSPTINVTKVIITGIDTPVALATPDITANVAATPTAGITSPTAAVTWDPAHASFDYSTVYTASLTLTAAQGYAFTSATSATVNGEPATSVTLNQNGTLTVTYEFPETEDEPSNTHVIDLKAGWNLVSFNLIPDDDSIEVILADIIDDVLLVYAWDATKSDSWMRYVPLAGFGNTLAKLNNEMGFWINMAKDETLTITGTPPTATDIKLYKGWNLIGYPARNDVAIPGALTAIDEKYDLILAYKAFDTDDPWKLYDPSAPGYANDLTTMAPGWGYWIHFTETTAFDWSIPF